jgi:hypothetical protein
MLPTFEEYMNGFNDLSFFENAQIFYNFGKYLKRKYSSSEFDDLIASFYNITCAAGLEALIDITDVFSDPDYPDAEIDISYELYVDMEDEIKDAAYEIAYNSKHLLFLQIQHGVRSYETVIKEVKLIGAFILGLGIDPKPYIDKYLQQQMKVINEYSVYLN